VYEDAGSPSPGGPVSIVIAATGLSAGSVGFCHGFACLSWLGFAIILFYEYY